jgi:ABC-type phosphate transport system substrate-binding protein
VYVVPSTASVSAAGRISPRQVAPDLTIDFSASPVPGAYPITTTTWVLTYSDYTKAGKAGSLAGVRSLLTYVYSPAAQAQLAGLGYAPLPAQVLRAAAAQMARLG